MRFTDSNFLISRRKNPAMLRCLQSRASGVVKAWQATIIDTITRGEPFEEARQRLNAWRTSIIARDFKHALFGPSAILSDDMIDLLTSVGNIKMKSYFEEMVECHWGWYSEYGAELFALVSSWEIPKQAKAPKESLKRTREEGVTVKKNVGDKAELVDGPATSAKRARASVVTGRKTAAKESENNVASSSRLNLIPRTQIGQPHSASFKPLSTESSGIGNSGCPSVRLYSACPSKFRLGREPGPRVAGPWIIRLELRNWVRKFWAKFGKRSEFNSEILFSVLVNPHRMVSIFSLAVFCSCFRPG
jgi:hypothetical protein